MYNLYHTVVFLPARGPDVRERLDLMGGQLQIANKLGQGSLVRLTVPDVCTASGRGRVEPTVADTSISSVLASGHEAIVEAGSGHSVIRVMLVDDHIVLRQGLSLVLRGEPDMRIVAEASDGQTAVDMVRLLRPDVVLMDISMPVMDGVEATRIIRAECPEVRVIGLSGSRRARPPSGCGRPAPLASLPRVAPPKQSSGQSAPMAGTPEYFQPLFIPIPHCGIYILLPTAEGSYESGTAEADRTDP